VWLIEGKSIDEKLNTMDTTVYEEKLGIVHQAQQDFKRLSKAMAHPDNKLHFPRGPPRIVIFIDDLDRCPPDKVVETLEAVQLLVKQKLFIVVIPIDSRYVTLSLEKHYKGVLRPIEALLVWIISRR